MARRCRRRASCSRRSRTWAATEEDAIAEYAGDIDVYVSKFKPMKNTVSGRDERTFMKLLVHAATDQVSHTRN